MTSVSRTLPEHATCATHEKYLLSCADYEDLLTESRSGCQMCGFPANKMPQKRLYIDHDHDGYVWGVRGLLCIRCNSGLGDPRQPAPAGADAYLANAWYLRKLAERGITLDCPEPPVGAVIQDYRLIYWHHSGDDCWKPIYGTLSRQRTWDQMYRLCGPLSMRVVYTWDGRDWAALERDLPQMPSVPRTLSRAVLERRITGALALVRSHQWCPQEQKAVAALVTALTAIT